MTVKIYHNPRCGKSRQTLQLLQERGAEPEVIEFASALKMDAPMTLKLSITTERGLS